MLGGVSGAGQTGVSVPAAVPHGQETNAAACSGPNPLLMRGRKDGRVLENGDLSPAEHTAWSLCCCSSPHVGSVAGPRRDGVSSVCRPLCRWPLHRNRTRTRSHPRWWACPHSGFSLLQLVLDSQKRVFSWGFGGYGRLGHAEQKDEMVPRLVKLFDFPGRGASQIYAGYTCSFAVSEVGESLPRRP